MSNKQKVVCEACVGKPCTHSGIHQYEMLVNHKGIGRPIEWLSDAQQEGIVLYENGTLAVVWLCGHHHNKVVKWGSIKLA